MRNPARRLQKTLWLSRTLTYGIMMPLAAFSLSMPTISGVARLAYVLFGFSLIIFLHELGHFVVARFCSVKCLAFSLGIGPRMFGWRKGGGFTVGADKFDPEVIAKRTAKRDEKTSGEKEDEKIALRPLDPAPSTEQKIQHMESATTHSDLPTSADAPPHSKSIGDTDYRVSWLPLGGYVRMLGQDDMDPTKISTDPHAFNQRPIWQRMCIVSAGVIMNLIFAAAAFSVIFSPGVGVDFPRAEIGSVEYNSPAWKAGLRMGDSIVGINGSRPSRGFLEFTDVKIASALSSGSDPIEFEYFRPSTGETKKVHILPAYGGDGFLGIGVGPMPNVRVIRSQDKLDEAVDEHLVSVKDGGIGEPNIGKVVKTLRPGDEIQAVDNLKVSDYPALYSAIQVAGPRPVSITLKNPDPKLGEKSVTTTPVMRVNPGVTEFPSIFGLAPQLRVEFITRGGAADRARMEPGDIILKIGDRDRPSAADFRRIARENPGKALKVAVRRGDKTIPLDVTLDDVKGSGLMGVLPGNAFDDMTVVVRDQAAATLPADLNLQTADARLVKVDGTPVKNWAQVVWLLQQKKAGDPIEMTFATTPAAASQPASQAVSQAAHEVTTSFAMTSDLSDSLHQQVAFMLDFPIEFKTERQHADSGYGAVMMGLDHTEKFIEQVYMTLVGLVRQTVSPSNLHGMLGISKVGYDIQEKGSAWFWYLMAIVSVNLAVANFLPVPIVDGGLFLLLILEKIRGKPLSLKVQSAIQVVGIVLLAGMFIYVTINDLSLFK